MHDPDLRVYAIWVPVNQVQTPPELQRNAGRESPRVLHDNRVVNFLDPHRRATAAFATALRLPQRNGVQIPAWDVYLVYRPGDPWETPAPAPQHWMHQLSWGAPPENKLAGDQLRLWIENATEKVARAAAAR